MDTARTDCKCGESYIESEVVGNGLEIVGYGTREIEYGIWCNHCGDLLVDRSLCNVITYHEKAITRVDGPF